MIALTVASPVLEYAVASFSSLVYSIHMDRGAERFAFLYYAEALKGLRAMLDKMDRLRNILFRRPCRSLTIGIG